MSVFDFAVDTAEDVVTWPFEVAGEAAGDAAGGLLGGLGLGDRILQLAIVVLAAIVAIKVL